MKNAFSLEKAYRDGYSTALFDLSASAPDALQLKDLLCTDAELESFLCSSLAYGPGGGSPELRAAIAALYDDLSPENVLITAGGQEAIRAVAMALIPSGSRVLIQQPTYEAIEAAIADQGAVVEPLRAGPDGNFDLRCLTVSRAETALLNSPTGFGGSIVRGLNCFRGRLIVDEVYRPIALTPGAPSRSAIDIHDTAVVIGDLSKPLGLGGLRVGWIASRDPQAVKDCRVALDYLSGSISVLSSRVAVAAVQRFDEILSVHTARARRNLAILAAFIEQHEQWIDWSPPQAGFTAHLRLRAGPLPDQSFRRLRDAGVFLLPGESVGCADDLRIGLGGNEAGFARAIALLGDELRLLPRTPSPQKHGDVIVFTKAPRPGFGKSRLAAEIGTDAAHELATAFLEDTVERTTARASRFFVAVAPPDAVPDLMSTLSATEVFAQAVCGDLGSKLQAAFDEAFASGATSPVLLGSDSPTLPAHLISIAHRALETSDVVLGPAEDGGYYAIGLRAPAPAVFEGIEWSTPRVLEQTLARCAAAGLEVFFLPYWYDVDDAAGLERLVGDPLLGAATAVALRKISS